MQTVNEKLIGFLKENPKSNKAAISEATGMRGIVLFNLLRKLTTEGLIFYIINGGETIYSANEQSTSSELSNDESDTDVANEQSEAEEQEIAEKTDDKQLEKEETGDTNDDEDMTSNEEPVSKKSKGRDNSKYKFCGQFYGKGPLVRAVVAAYVKDNAPVTYKKLKEVFPDELLKRFGIFQDEIAAREISKKGERYFFKEEHVIKLKDKRIVVCNQFTFDNIQPFLKVAKELGYKIK